MSRSAPSCAQSEVTNFDDWELIVHYALLTSEQRLLGGEGEVARRTRLKVSHVTANQQWGPAWFSVSECLTRSNTQYTTFQHHNRHRQSDHALVYRSRA